MLRKSLFSSAFKSPYKKIAEVLLLKGKVSIAGIMTENVGNCDMNLGNFALLDKLVLDLDDKKAWCISW
jgi:hypothetical protein